jgi:alkanesulfonate monooxygenase SsuD/methylene tetrahydromethanopterin reductase-like flavin-dependent oxidoreductase (luciferase family)
VEFATGFTFHVPSYRWETDPDAEHTSLMADMQYAVDADRLGFKYALFAEHHFLHEYSHTNSNEAMIAYVAAKTERIHLMSGIFNPLPSVNHPVKVAERVALLDHLTEGRFEFGTGRGAGSYEILGFLPGIDDMNETKAIWDDVIREYPKMWMQQVYEGHESKYWRIPPRPVVPKPWRYGHPAMWYAAGNPSSWETAGRMGLGVIGFSIDSLAVAEKAVKVYKKAAANAEPIGAFANNYLMAVCQASISEDREKAIDWACGPENAYYNSQTFRYHDTFQRPPGIPEWPEIMPQHDRDSVPLLQEAGMPIGDPDEALRVLKRWEEIGVDGVIFGVGPLGPDHGRETLECIGKYIIPELDKDPVHLTTRYRDTLKTDAITHPGVVREVNTASPADADVKKY